MKVLKKKVREGLIPQLISDKILEEALEPALHDMLHFHPSQEMVENLAAAIQSTIIERDPRFPSDDSKSSADEIDFSKSSPKTGIRGWFGRFGGKETILEEDDEDDLDDLDKTNSASPLMGGKKSSNDSGFNQSV